MRTWTTASTPREHTALRGPCVRWLTAAVVVTRVDLRTGYRTRSILCVPILHPDNGVMGAVEMINKTSAQRFSKEDETVCLAFGSAVAVALYNATLCDSLMLTAARSEALMQIVQVEQEKKDIEEEESRKRESTERRDVDSDVPVAGHFRIGSGDCCSPAHCRRHTWRAASRPRHAVPCGSQTRRVLLQGKRATMAPNHWSSDCDCCRRRLRGLIVTWFANH